MRLTKSAGITRERDAQETSRYLSQSGGRGARINMALDPSISLGFRPPVIPPSQILNPVEQFGQILSLRNLMTQGQLGQLGLQTKQLEVDQLRRQMQEQQEYADAMKAYAQGAQHAVAAGSGQRRSRPPRLCRSVTAAVPPPMTAP